MNLLKKIPFFLFLLVLFFCLHGGLENYGYLGVGEVVKVGLIACIGMAVVFCICWLFTKKNFMLASLICFFIALWYLFFGAIHDWVKSMEWLSFIHSYSAILLLLFAATIVWILLLKRFPTFKQKLFFYLNVLLIIYCLFDGYLLLKKWSAKKETTTASVIPVDLSKVKSKPNVYFLLFDCYAGYNNLRDSFGFKNDSLYNFLNQQSFKIIPSLSNYNFTFFSMASMLNMEYIRQDYTNKIAVQEDMQTRVKEIRHAQLFDIFSSMGYEIENNSIFDIGHSNGVSNNNTIVPMHSYLITNKILHNRLILDLGYQLYKFDYFNRRHIFEHDEDNQQVYDRTMATIEQKGSSPKFVYAHLLMPHAPYFKDSLGNYIPVTQFNVGSKHSYLSYLKYTNTVIKKMIRKITALDSLAIVILTSDHGYNDKGVVRIFDPAKIAAEQYSFENIFAIRFPGQQFDSTRTTMSSVNMFRFLLNAQFGQQIPYLKDSTVWVNHD